jgi:hypothetical protein
MPFPSTPVPWLNDPRQDERVSMSALRFFKVPVGLTVTALALSGVMTFSTSCAGGGGGGGSGGGGQAGNDNNGGSGGDTTVSCTPDDTHVCFKDGQAQGAMTGWGWIALGVQDELSDPTCDTDEHPITSANACTTTTNWNSSDGLCMSGTIPALPAAPLQSDYDNNWGIQIGVNSSEPPGTTLGKDYTSVTLTTTGSPTSGLRAELHVKGESPGQTYCLDMKSGRKLELASFNKECWDGTNAAKNLPVENIPNIDKVGIQVSSTQSEIKVDNLCLVGITFE